jgi:hypothetical protein
MPRVNRTTSLDFYIPAKTGGAAFVMAICLATGCRDAAQPANSSNKVKSMTTLTISKTSDGFEKQIGTLVFDESNKATLTTEGSGPEAERLRNVWEEVAKLDTLPMQRAEEKEVDGNLVTSIRAYIIPKSDKRYPGAVWSVLERHHGYLVDQKD